MKYSIDKHPIVSSEFHRIFGIGFHHFLDPLASMAEGKLCIDLLHFDVWLHSKWGAYDEGKSAMSMKELLRSKYSERASELIESLI